MRFAEKCTRCWIRVTLCGGLSICSHQTSCAFVHLKQENANMSANSKKIFISEIQRVRPLLAPYFDANNNALFLDELGEQLPTVWLLVECLVEEDDATHTVWEGGIRGEEDVTEAAAVLLGVLHVDFLEPLRHGAFKEKHNTENNFTCMHSIYLSALSIK